MKNIRSALLSLSLLSAMIFTASGHASLSNGQVNHSAQAQALVQMQSELIQQQDWMTANLWEDFGVQVSVKDYSSETMKQLRALHQALKNNEPLAQGQFSHIIITCRKAECGGR